MPNLTQDLRAEYEKLFADAVVRAERLTSVKAAADKIFSKANMAQYKAVSDKTKIPPWFVGIIHNMESSLSFKGHLHNGDPLTARTRQVPAGRPRNGSPPFTWEESAMDALIQKKLDQWTDWSIAGIAFRLETYNGWGYRNHHPEVKSPYLWSFTTIYASGKYVADGKWSPTAVSGQVGGMALLRYMVDAGLVTISGADGKKAQAAKPADIADEPPAQPALGLSPAPAPVLFPGTVLQNGSSGPAVRQLQERLVALGISVATDSDFGDKTEAAVRVFQARTDDDTGMPLEIDGIIGRRTWRALFGDESVLVPTEAPADTGGTKAASDALAVAISQIGVMEDPIGSNRGAEIDDYLSSVDPSLLGNPWCMAFVYWCFKQVAKGNATPAAPRTAGVLRSWQLAQALPKANIVTAAQARRNPGLVRPGMVFYIDTGSGTGHTGFVSAIVDGRLSTVEGNTTMKEGSREGIGVFARAARRIEQINVGFIEFG